MSTFDDREQSFENKFKHDQDLRFRVLARRAKLIGLWAAGHLGLTGAEAEAYARQVVDADFEEPSHHDILRKIHKDLAGKGIDISEHRIEKEMQHLLDVAQEQVNAE